MTQSRSPVGIESYRVVSWVVLLGVFLCARSVSLSVNKTTSQQSVSSELELGPLHLSFRASLGDEPAMPSIRLRELAGSGEAVGRVNLLFHEEVSIRREAAKTLEVVQDARALIPLTVALRDADSIVRSYAASALGALRDHRAVAPLCSALRDENWCVRYAAVLALDTIGDPGAIPELQSVVRDADRQLSSDARNVIERLQMRTGADRLAHASR